MTPPATATLDVAGVATPVPVPNHRPDPPRGPQPLAWLLLPGLAALAGSVLVFGTLLRTYYMGYFDLGIYYAAAEGLRHGRPLYAGPTFEGMPFTYPPFAAALLTGLTLVEKAQAARVMVVASLAALAWVVWLALGQIGTRGAGRLGLAAGSTAVLLWLEPVQFTLTMGQINLVLLAAVVFDLTRRPDRWYLGIGVGLATGVKLTPGLFLVYLLVTRQFRAFLVACGALLATILAGFVITPGDSAAYWGGVFADGGRIGAVTALTSPSNQSLYGLAGRVLPGGAWYVLVVITLVTGMAVAARVHRAGHDLAAVALVGLLTLLVSPVSWTHHWVWIVVVLIALTDAVRRLLPDLPAWGQIVAAGVPPALLLVFLDWPARNSRGHLVPRGLVWMVPADGSAGARIAGEAYVLAALVILGAAVWWVRRSPRRYIG